jgi:hypothetical protein
VINAVEEFIKAINSLSPGERSLIDADRPLPPRTSSKVDKQSFGPWSTAELQGPTEFDPLWQYLGRVKAALAVARRDAARRRPAYAEQALAISVYAALWAAFNCRPSKTRGGGVRKGGRFASVLKWAIDAGHRRSGSSVKRGDVEELMNHGSRATTDEDVEWMRAYLHSGRK